MRSLISTSQLSAFLLASSISSWVLSESPGTQPPRDWEGEARVPLFPENGIVTQKGGQLQLVHSVAEDQKTGVDREIDRAARRLDLTTYIYPGTKYCGVGNISDTYIPPEKYHAAEDACCKAHDECPNYIPPGQKDTVSGLTNECSLSQSDCACEEAFFNCLKKIGSMNANILGTIYFSGMIRKCYIKKIPLKCKSGLIWTRLTPTTCNNCFNYCTDTTAPAAYHWRPTSLFSMSDKVLTDPPPC